MNDRVSIRYISNCCLQISAGGDSIVIDGPYEDENAFDGMDPKELHDMIESIDAYSNVRGFLFTHSHEDHFSFERLKSCMENRTNTLVAAAPDCLVSKDGDQKLDKLFPGRVISLAEAEGVFEVGCMTVRYYKTDHMPLKDEEPFYNYMFVVSTDNRRILISGDMKPDEGILEKIGKCDHYDCVIFNLLVAQKRAWKRAMAKIPTEETLIYHIPSEKADRFRYRKVAIKAAELSEIEYRLLLGPTTIDL